MTAWTIGRLAPVRLEALDERAVDLDRVERQVLEVRQGRVAGPEVVEDELDAELAQRPQRSRPGLRLVHQDALGDLELEQVGRQAGLGEDRRRPASTRSGWVNWRADRLTLMTSCDPGSVSSQARACRQAVSSTQRPIGMIRPVSSASGMNDSGGTRPRVGCCQRTSASSPTIRLGREVDDRLVVEPQLVALERAAEVVLELDPLHRRRAHRRLERTCSACPASRFAWTRAISASRKRSAGVAPAGPGDRDPEARVDEPLAIAEGERRAADSTIRSAIRRASSSPPIPSRMIPNSSPPKRATVSPGRRQRRAARRPQRGADRRPRGRGSR